MQRNFRYIPNPPMGHLVAVAYGSGKDDYLATVLVYIPSENVEQGEWVIWTWNCSGKPGFSSGNYFTEHFHGAEKAAEMAWNDFSNRGRDLALKASQWSEVGMLDIRRDDG
jgi:hypothetical protein